MRIVLAQALPAVVTPTPAASPSASPSLVVTRPEANGSESTWDRVLHWMLGVPLAVLLIIVVAVVLIVVVNWLVGRIVHRLSTKAAEQSQAQAQADLRNPLAALKAGARRQQRIASIGALLKSLLAVIISATALLTILPLFGINITPLLVSASVLGVALGFGAQNLIKDYLAGIFIVLEDQYGVGDSIEVLGVKGVVEDVTLRITELRDDAGVAWYVRNGEILKVANRSKFPADGSPAADSGSGSGGAGGLDTGH